VRDELLEESMLHLVWKAVDDEKISVQVGNVRKMVDDSVKIRQTIPALSLTHRRAVEVRESERARRASVSTQVIRVSERAHFGCPQGSYL
jgi:hypothetical protein